MSVLSLQLRLEEVLQEYLENFPDYEPADLLSFTIIWLEDRAGELGSKERRKQHQSINRVIYELIELRQLPRL